MPIQLACPHCGRRVRIEDRSASASCPDCGRSFTVPNLSGPPALEADRAPPAREAAGRPGRRPRRIRGRRARLKSLLVAEVGSILVVVPLAFAALSLFRSSDPPVPVEDEGESAAGSDGPVPPGPAPVSPEGLADRVREGSARVARTYAAAKKVAESSDVPSGILVQVLQAVSQPGVVVTHPTYEDERLRAEFSRLQGAARLEHGQIDDVLYLQLAMRAETAIRNHFDGRASAADAGAAYREEVARFGAAAGVPAAELSAGLSVDRRQILVYFFYRLALIHRTRAVIASSGVQEAAWIAATRGVPARAWLPAPPPVAWTPGAKGPPERHPDVPDPPEDPPEIPDPPVVDDPPPRSPLPAIGASTTVEDLRRIVAGRSDSELQGLPDDLIGVGISGRVAVVRYGQGDPAREFQDLTLQGSAAGDAWRIELVGKAAVPADDRLAARLAAGSRVEIAGQILQASIEPGKIVLSVRILRLTRSND